MKAFSLLLLTIIALAGFVVLNGAPVAAASCGDVVELYGAGQYFAPLTVKVSFQQTVNRDEFWTSNGLVNGQKETAKTTKESNYMTFEAAGNDTYSFWFSGSYDSPVYQNITVTITEGDRPVKSEIHCMNGTHFFLEWTDATVVFEPHPLSQDQVAQAVYPEISQSQVAVANAISALAGSINVNTGGTFFIGLGFFGIAYELRKLRKRLGG